MCAVHALRHVFYLCHQVSEQNPSAGASGEAALSDIACSSEQLRVCFLPEEDMPQDWTQLLEFSLYTPLPPN